MSLPGVGGAGTAHGYNKSSIIWFFKGPYIILKISFKYWTKNMRTDLVELWFCTTSIWIAVVCEGAHPCFENCGLLRGAIFRSMNHYRAFIQVLTISKI